LVQKDASLTLAASEKGRFFGAAVRIDQINSEPLLREAVLRDCSWVTPEIHLNWDAIEWNKGELAFGPVDDLLAFATRHGLKVHGHTLLWDQSTPKWAKESMLIGDWKPIHRHFSSVISRYQGQIDQWNVVNEPIDVTHRQDGLRANTFLRSFGPNYIQRAFEEARTFAPNARLLINDYGFDYDNSEENRRRYMFLRLLERLKKVGVPLDAVGIQAHLDLSKGPLKEKIISKFLDDVAGFGLDIVISELDVKECDFAASLAERDKRVALETKRYLDVALSNSATRGVITWGLSDKHSWLQTEASTSRKAFTADDPSLNRGLPYDAALEKKAMYRALQSAFTTKTS
jgi:endo-1,4-beta-xylanase